MGGYSAAMTLLYPEPRVCTVADIAGLRDCEQIGSSAHLIIHESGYPTHR